MKLSYSKFAERANALKARVAHVCRSCGRDPDEVELLAVTKAHSAQAVEFASRYGLKSIGENRVQEAHAKKKECDAAIRWEMIGYLQSNKARMAVSLFDRIQSVDRIKLLRALDHYCGEDGKVLPILLQVNAGDDPKKHGVSCEEAPDLLKAALCCTHLQVEGFMTIAPLDEDSSVAAAAFRRLRELRDSLARKYQVPLPQLSMGMTGDVEEAVKAGSTCLRVGTALFGARPD